jgi:hypothetical protein
MAITVFTREKQMRLLALYFRVVLNSQVLKLFYINIFMADSQVYNGNINTIDGCATFFRRDRFSHVKKYEVQICFYVCVSTFKFVHNIIVVCFLAG